MPLVLIVDDDADTRELYDAYLAIWGFGTSMACDGVQGLRMAQTERPDVIVLDIRLPLLDGWDLMRELRRDPRTSSAFIIVLTADTQTESVARSRAAGCDVFLTKPCVPEHLVVEVMKWAQREAAC
jgi:CheY-like chemotaxis protein